MHVRKVLALAMLGVVAVAAVSACAPTQHPSPGTVAADDPALAARVRAALKASFC
jgi:hypothetical protein